VGAFTVVLWALGAVLLLVLILFAVRSWFLRLEERVLRPDQVASSPGPVLVQQPPHQWWDALETLRLHVDTEVMRMQGYAAGAEQAYRNARSSEERARKRIRSIEQDDQDEEDPAQLTIPPGWEAAPAIAAQPTNGARQLSPMEQMLEQRRARGNA